jgi:putative restriction endonuclease
VTDAGFLYAYRAGDVDQPDNRALRAAHSLQVPVAYFVGTRPGWYQALYPTYVTHDDPGVRQVLLAVGAMAGPIDDPEPVLPHDPIARRYAMREVRVRLHQARFRNRVLPAYRYQCTVCRLKERRLLDAAHIAADVDPRGAPAVSNGLSLCSIHRRAFDQRLVGISPDYRVHVSERLLLDEDGPMLEVLKTFQDSRIEIPRRKDLQPDRDLLAVRFEEFVKAA